VLVLKNVVGPDVLLQCLNAVIPPPLKQGRCPRPRFTRDACGVRTTEVVRSWCSSQGGDAACPINQKCCWNGCSSQCVIPETATRAEGDDYSITDESFALSDIFSDEALAVQNPNSLGIPPETSANLDKMPVWAISLCVVFSIVLVVLIVVLVQLFLMFRRQ